MSAYSLYLTKEKDENVKENDDIKLTLLPQRVHLSSVGSQPGALELVAQAAGFVYRVPEA